ncbi:MAG: ROK family protein [Acholeplasmataceae bacterium]|jgi:glucokinase
MKYYFGVDVGGTEVKFGFFDNAKKLLDTFKVKTPTENVREELVGLIYEIIVNRLDKEEITLDSLHGIGIAIPGPVINGVINFCANLNVGYDFDIATAIKEKFEIPHLKVVVGNDANLAAYGEYKVLGRSNISNLVFITLGTGVGGGIIVNGKLVTGFTGAAGEIGHMPYDIKNNRRCGCGGTGCVETIAGTAGMIQTANDLMRTESSIMKDKTMSPKLIFDSAKEGDLVALKVADSVSEAIGHMAAIISTIVDPEIYIIGGGISQAGQFLLSKINYHYQKLARFETGKSKFELAKLGNDAGFYGAFYLLIED